MLIKYTLLTNDTDGSVGNSILNSANSKTGATRISYATDNLSNIFNHFTESSVDLGQGSISFKSTDRGGQSTISYGLGFNDVVIFDQSGTVTLNVELNPTSTFIVSNLPVTNAFGRLSFVSSIAAEHDERDCPLNNDQGLFYSEELIINYDPAVSEGQLSYEYEVEAGQPYTICAALDYSADYLTDDPADLSASFDATISLVISENMSYTSRSGVLLNGVVHSDLPSVSGINISDGEIKASARLDSIPGENSFTFDGSFGDTIVFDSDGVVTMRSSIGTGENTEQFFLSALGAGYAVGYLSSNAGITENPDFACYNFNQEENALYNRISR